MSQLYRLKGGDTPYRPLWIVRGKTPQFKSLMTEIGWTEISPTSLNRISLTNSCFYQARPGSPVIQFSESSKADIDQSWLTRIKDSSLKAWFPSTTARQSAEILAEWAQEQNLDGLITIREVDVLGCINVTIPQLLGFTIKIVC